MGYFTNMARANSLDANRELSNLGDEIETVRSSGGRRPGLDSSVCAAFMALRIAEALDFIEEARVLLDGGTGLREDHRSASDWRSWFLFYLVGNA